MLWLAAYLTGFPPVGLHALCWTHGLAPGILWVVMLFQRLIASSLFVSMPSWAWVVTKNPINKSSIQCVSMPSWAWVVTQLFAHFQKVNFCFNALMGLSCYLVMPTVQMIPAVSMPSWAWVVTASNGTAVPRTAVSMPSWAWVVTHGLRYKSTSLRRFNALMGLSCYSKNVQYFKFFMILFYTYLLFIGIY